MKLYISVVMPYAYAETEVMFSVSDHYDHYFYCVILP